MKTYEQQTLQFGEDASTCFPEDFPANRSARQGKEKVRRTTATYGRKCFEQFARFPRVGSWAKTFSELLIGTGEWYSSRCALTWRLKGTKFNRIYFQLAVSALRINETESGLLLKTPSAFDATVSSPKKNPVPGNSGSLAQEIMCGYVKKIRLLPTPAAQNCKGASSIEALKARERLKTKADNLADQFAVSGKTSQLNPLFVDEMMGFPVNWTVLPFLPGAGKASKPTEMR